MFCKKLFFVFIAFICFSNNASDPDSIRSYNNKVVAASASAAVIMVPLLVFAGVGYVFFGLKPDIPETLRTLFPYCVGTASFVFPTTLVYEVGKRGYIPRLTDYFKSKKCLLNTSFQVSSGKVKIGLDCIVSPLTMCALAYCFRSIDDKYEVFQLKKNKGYGFGVLIGQAVVNLWAQQTVLPAKYNPFVWTNDQGKSESVLIFPSKWGKPLLSSDGAMYKVLLDSNS